MLSATHPARNAAVVVTIQNRSPHPVTIPDEAALASGVSLAVESRGPCPAPMPRLRTPQAALDFPLTLGLGQTAAVVFDVRIDCANDPAAATFPLEQADYRYTAMVRRTAIDAVEDTHPEDDVCPRSVTPPVSIYPKAAGTIKDRGCGAPKPDGTLGAPVVTDVVVQN